MFSSTSLEASSSGEMEPEWSVSKSWNACNRLSSDSSLCMCTVAACGRSAAQCVRKNGLVLDRNRAQTKQQNEP